VFTQDNYKPPCTKKQYVLNLPKHEGSSSLTSKVSPNSCVIVVRSTRGTPCEQLLAVVEVGAGPSVIYVGVVVVVLVVPSLSSGPCHCHHHGLVLILVIPSSSLLTLSSSATCRCPCPCLIGLLSFAPCHSCFCVLVVLSSSGGATVMWWHCCCSLTVLLLLPVPTP
jgi:hypothetical protein